MSIEVNDVSKSFESYKALENINLEVKTGELVALLGPSGSGKTTLLRIIAGLETSDYGNILFNGEDHTKKRVQDRGVGFVFQHYALFKQMTVFDNIAFGLNIRPKKYRLSKKEIKEKVEELLELVKMKEFGNRYPTQLSGGQRQRIALARALAVEPKVLLLDEPFGALDAKVRKDLRRWLRNLHNDISITSLFVTHDQEEAMDVADRIVILNQGKIEQIGTPEEVYENPATPFVYNFLGNVNLFKGRVQGGKVRIGTAEFDAPEYMDRTSENAVSYVRPYNIEIKREHTGKGFIRAKIIFIRPLGSTIHIELKREDEDQYLEAELSRDVYKELNLKTGEAVFVRLKDVKVFIPEDYVI
ncbi:sulfate ABC transporter ATP-binding protein CysA [Gottschalkia acidurici 9a]|uniref:Sulfate ABC transporter ATP-binding protein CysA n=1 Tax=Gottschalkia acidurici (strain ATCC 7906 / DSM 604 / BCRC 14475 / CIP 104303 / KCTC 5404 / NCIMB 10678 / 9a) TaxID=1128398 RepID=K0B3X6_GOTA9|nr:sulfate/molybdate ABC transporter ATP-binding protein [Gottschalkia acidurici]AFS79620.1 sulfate ABC transporter ATP-binding protein CysA [Gottschalkia acidurici 9a]